MQPQLKDIPFRDGEFAERSCARLYKVKSFEIGYKSELMTMVVDHSPNSSNDDVMIVQQMTVWCTGWLVVRQLPWRKLERWVTALPLPPLIVELAKSYKTDKLPPCPWPHPLTSIFHLNQSFVPQLWKFQKPKSILGTSNFSCWNVKMASCGRGQVRSAMCSCSVVAIFLLCFGA